MSATRDRHSDEEDEYNETHLDITVARENLIEPSEPKPMGRLRQDTMFANARLNQYVRGALMLTTATLAIWFGVVAVLTFQKSNFLDPVEWAQLSQNAWLGPTIMDFYFLLFAFACWVFFKESNWIVSLLWIVGMCLLGSPVANIFVFRQLWKLKPDEPVENAFIRR